MADSDLRILIDAILKNDAIPKIKEQLDDIKKKYGKLNIDVKMDDSVIKTLQGFTQSMEKFQAATEAQNKTVEQFIDITKKLDGSTVTVTKSIDALGQVSVKTRTTLDETKKSVDSEAQSYENLSQKIKIADKSLLDSIATNRNAQNTPTGVNVKSSQGYTSTTTRLQGDGETLIGSTTVENYKKQRQDELKAQEDHLKQTRANLLQEENEWKSFVSAQQQSYDKYITTTGKGLLQEDKDFNDFVAKQEQNYNKLNATTNKSLLQEENELKAFITKQEQSYQKYLSDREANLQKEQQIRQAIADAQTKQDIAQNKLGTNVGTSPKFGLDFKEAQDYAKTLTGVDAELRNIGYSVNAAGEKIQTLNIQTKEGGKYQKDWTATLNQATGQTHLFEKGLSDVATRSLGFVEALKAAMVRLPTFLLAGAAVGGSLGFITDGIKYVNEFNATLTQIGTAVNYSQGKLTSLGQQFQQLGKDLKASTADVATGALEFYRQGLNDDQVLERLKTTTQYAKISGLAFQQSADLLTAATNTTKLDINQIADVFTLLGDKTATSASEIGQAFQKVGATASSLQIPFEKVSAMIATVSAVTRQSATTVGTAINSILSRVESVRKVGFDATDGTSINQVSEALSKAGVQLMDSNKQFRNFSDVLDDLSKKWGSLDTVTQRYVATTVKVAA